MKKKKLLLLFFSEIIILMGKERKYEIFFLNLNALLINLITHC